MKTRKPAQKARVAVTYTAGQKPRPGQPVIAYTFPDGSVERVDLLWVVSTESRQRKQLLEAQREEKSARMRSVAQRPRKTVTREALLAHRSHYVKRHKTERGWMKAACLEFGVSKDTIRKRMDK